MTTADDLDRMHYIAHELMLKVVELRALILKVERSSRSSAPAARRPLPPNVLRLVLKPRDEREDRPL